MEQRLPIPAAEWMAVYQTVLPFLHDDERLAVGNVRLRTSDGQRRRWAVDPWRITVAKGGVQNPGIRVDVALPARLVEAAVMLSADPADEVVLEIGSGHDGDEEAAPSSASRRAGRASRSPRAPASFSKSRRPPAGGSKPPS